MTATGLERNTPSFPPSMPLFLALLHNGRFALLVPQRTRRSRPGGSPDVDDDIASPTAP
ncbi:MAG: hypothetical protein WBG36_05240 [Ornithinimicrobium sp.]